jgi:hypothetical protein
MMKQRIYNVIFWIWIALICIPNSIMFVAAIADGWQNDLLAWPVFGAVIWLVGATIRYVAMQPVANKQ